MKLNWSCIALTAVGLAAGFFHPTVGAAQVIRPKQPDLAIDAVMRGEVIEGVLRELSKSYVFPDVADKMEKAIRERQQEKEYDDIQSAMALAQTLTAHLQEVSKDKHLRVLYSYEPIPEPKGEPAPPTPAERAQFRLQGEFRNFGFEKVERLSGNIGYLDFRNFAAPAEAGETAAAAMNFLANTHALIIDLRQNHGGTPAMVAFLSSYLFEGPPVHLNDIYWRPDDSTHQWWTLPYVPGKRYGSKDVYVLTSNETFSAAEEFTYNLKNLKRATIVGETTGGGAHPGGGHRINDHFGIGVPTGRAINPISKTNWEGTGVKPDIEVPAAEALKTAHLAALRKLLEIKPEDAQRIANSPFPLDEHMIDMWKEELRRAIEKLEKQPDREEK